MLARASGLAMAALVLASALLPPGTASVVVCMEAPFCGYGAARDTALARERQVLDGLNKAGAAGTPDASSAVLLVGRGVATVARYGAGPSPCEGDALMVVEGSPKHGGLEPTVTITYGYAWHWQPDLVLPCSMGHTHQPVQRQIQGSFSGPWSASQDWDTNGWSITVGAPSNGARDVSYTFWTEDGDEDTFTGTLLEWR